jgi:hypothetical protein
MLSFLDHTHPEFYDICSATLADAAPYSGGLDQPRMVKIFGRPANASLSED